MDFLKDVIGAVGIPVAMSVIVIVASYIGLKIKDIIKKKFDDETTMRVVKTCVDAVEQIYTEIHGADKLAKCMEFVCDVLNSKGIEVNRVELRMLIESAVKAMNDQFNEDLKYCREYTQVDRDNIDFKEKTLESVSRLLTEIL